MDQRVASNNEDLPLANPRISSQQTQTTSPSSPHSPSTKPYTHDPDAESLYPPSTMTGRTDISTTSTLRFGSLSKLPLLFRSRSSTSTGRTSDTAVSASSSSPSTSKGTTSSQDKRKKPKPPKKSKISEEGDEEDKKKTKPRDPIKTVPSGKEPAVTFADLMYRHGGPGSSHPGSRRL
ncbi:hypothetical protein CPB86DRAFT_789943 [Serendipita vermifera]|nr:hypothetical protein CPB86DRAFT_789943 [Serendipita vermifera]